MRSVMQRRSCVRASKQRRVSERVKIVKTRRIRRRRRRRRRRKTTTTTRRATERTKKKKKAKKKNCKTRDNRAC